MIDQGFGKIEATIMMQTHGESGDILLITDNSPSILQRFDEIQKKTRGRDLYDMTPEIKLWIESQRLLNGLLTLQILHTSASLLINENYDPDVLVDLKSFFDRLVPDGDKLFTHTTEGVDDMPAHIRTALTQCHLSIPVRRGKLVLGQWQGIFLFEHRYQDFTRRISVHFIGE